MKTTFLLSLLFTFYLFPSTFCFAKQDYQQVKIEIDSLEKLLKTQEDTTRINTLYQLALIQKYSNPKKAKQYVNKAITEVDKEQIYLRASCLNLLGALLKHEGEYKQALENYLLALPLKQQIKDKRGVASTSNEIGTLYEQTNNYPQALRYYKQALEICEEI